MWRLRTNYHDRSKAHGEEKVTGFTKGTKAVTVHQYKKEMWKRQRKGWKKKEEVGSIGRDSLKGRIDENEVVDTLLFCVWRTDWNM